MHTLNLGILAHIDAGKTSLTEHLLHTTGVIDQLGRVDAGTTHTDTLALEQQRGITIKSAVVSFPINDVTVNLLDTPGHPDFIAEVERVLRVLDGAVLVISAVEGVQAQTRVLHRTLRRLRIPTLLFVNKLDRGGAQPDRVLEDIAGKLTPAIIPMGRASRPGTRTATFTPHDMGDPAVTTRLTGVLAEHDDALLAAYVDDTPVPAAQLRQALAVQTGRALVHPVFVGSAITGAGIDALTTGITDLLPAARGEADGPVSGAVFKVERGPAGEKIAYARLHSGTVRVRDRLRFGQDQEAKVTAIQVFDRGATVGRPAVAAGQIGKLWGLDEVRIGDPVGTPHAAPAERHAFAPPTLETIVVPRHPGDRGALHLALTQLAEQDPLINLRQDPLGQEISVSLYGEVQKQVVQATLAGDFNLEADFRETTTIYTERPIGTGTALETAPDPFLATVGLRVEPAPVGTGVEFRLEVEAGLIPLAFFKAVEDAVYETLHQGLYGWRVTDCTVAMTQAIRWRKFASSTAAEHRNLTPLVLMTALQQAGTQVYEPIHRFHLETPADILGQLLPALAPLCAIPDTPTTRGASCLLEGEIPAAQVHRLQQQLPALTRGEGVLEVVYDHDRPVRGPVPTRPRTDYDPLNREDYLLRLTRRVVEGNPHGRR